MLQFPKVTSTSSMP